MRSSTSANANNALLGFLVVLVSLLGLPALVKTIIFVVLGFLIIIFALASSNFGQHDESKVEKH
ncbi:MAG TPA: hypothetical protein VJB69_01540 [Candidatus Paceibacterota bacterium]